MKPCVSSASFLYQDTIFLSLINEIRTFPALPLTALPDQLDRPFVYVAAKTGGLIVLEESVQELKEVYRIPLDSLHGLEVMNVSQQGDLLFLALGNFFSGNAQSPGVAILDATEPGRPFIRSVWLDENEQSGSAFVLAEDDFAYLAAMDAGVYTFDISRPDNILPLSQLIPDMHFPLPDPGEIQRPNARGLAVDGAYLYVCYDAGGLRVIDVSDKEDPIEINRYINQEALNKQQAYNNILIKEGIGYVGVDFCGMEILDVNNPRDIRRIGWWNPWQCEGPSNFWFNSPGHINQVALDAERRLVFLSAGDSELQIVDVSDPVEPVLEAEYGQISNDLGTWGASIHDDKVYLTYINTLGIPFRGTWSGIKILQADVVNSTVERSLPDHFQIRSPQPNPFSNSIRFPIVLFSPQRVSLSIFNALGQEVARPLKYQFLSAGEQRVEWRPEAKIPPGLYHARWRIGDKDQAHSIVKHQ